MSTFSSRLIILFAIMFLLYAPKLITHPQDGRRGTLMNEATELILGNSHAKSITFADSTFTAYNAYVSGSGPNTALRAYIDHQQEMPNLCRVWLAVSPAYPFGIEAGWLSSVILNHFPGLYLSYHRVRHAFGPQPSRWRNVKHWLKFVLRGDINSDQIFRTIDGREASSRYMSRGQMSQEELEESGATAVTRHLGRIDEFSSDGFRIISIISDLTKENGQELIIFNPPFTNYYHSDVRLRALVESSAAWFADLSSEHDHVSFYDRIGWVEPKDYHLFLDADHLTYYGAIDFSRNLFAEVAAEERGVNRCPMLGDSIDGRQPTLDTGRAVSGARLSDQGDLSIQ